MIGRGTRLCKDVYFFDHLIGGEYHGKNYFFIFDYCGNFEFFRAHQEGIEGNETKALTECIFDKQIDLIASLQDGEYAEDKYQQFRNQLIEQCQNQIKELNDELVSVKLQKQYVEKYRKDKAFAFLGETDKKELEEKIAPLVFLHDSDEYAKRFDNFVYGLMLSTINQTADLPKKQNTIRHTAEQLKKKTTIPQIKAKLPLIDMVDTDEFWQKSSFIDLEQVRTELRSLIKFIVDGSGRKPIITHLNDEVISSVEGEPIDKAYDFEDYQKKVNRYVNENGDTAVIYKLTHNKPISQAEYGELERILTEKLGSKEDYRREYGDTPFGLLIRKIAKLDHEAAMEAFSQFLNDNALSSNQVAFIHKIINYIEQNRYMEDTTELMNPPFDKPQSFIKMFDQKTRTKLLEAIDGIKKNATVVVA